MARSSLQIVIKISKLCNLRCSYCYEFNELGNKAKISLADLGAMFARLRDYALANDIDTLRLIWHGGEPLLVKTPYYLAIGALQEQVFGDDLDYVNAVQTNLTVLSGEILEFLRSKAFFKSVGVSFDVYGDQRVDIRGRLQTDRVVDNMQRLLDNGVRFGAITVLSRNTRAHAVNICRFFDDLGIDCRFLPFYRSAHDGQIEAHALSGEEIVAALREVFDAWLVSEHGVAVDPVDEYLDYAIAVMTDGPKRRYDKESREEVLVVNTNGDVWGVAETYDPAYCYGNVFHEPLAAVMGSPGRRSAVAEAEARMARYCDDCPYFGHCPGFYVGDATPEQRRVLAEIGCPARALITHMIDRLERSELRDVIVAHAGKAERTNDALAVGL